MIDQTGQVAPGIRRYLDPQAMAERRDASFSRAIESAPMAARRRARPPQRAVLGELPELAIVESPAARARRAEGAAHARCRTSPARRARRPSQRRRWPMTTGIFGAYDLFVRRNLDNRIQNETAKRRCRSDRRRASARSGIGSAAHRRAHESRAPAVRHRHRRRENRRRGPISPGCCRWGSRSC